MIFPIIMHPRVMLCIQRTGFFHVSPAKHLLSVEHVNDHPRWTASLPLKAACDGSEWGRMMGRQTDRQNRKNKRETKWESSSRSDIFLFFSLENFLPLHNTERAGRTGSCARWSSSTSELPKRSFCYILEINTWCKKQRKSKENPKGRQWISLVSGGSSRC